MHDRWYEDKKETTSPRLPFLQAYLYSSREVGSISQYSILRWKATASEARNNGTLKEAQSVTDCIGRL